MLDKDGVASRRWQVIILNILSLGFTAWGVWLLFTGNLTHGFLSLIVGELIDIPKERAIR